MRVWEREREWERARERERERERKRESTTQALKPIGHPIFGGCLSSSPPHFEWSCALWFSKAPGGAAGQTFRGLSSAKTNGERGHRRVDAVVAFYASVSQLLLRIHAHLIEYKYIEREIYMYIPAAYHHCTPNLFRYDSDRGGVGQGWEGGGGWGDYEVCFFWKSRRKTYAELVRCCSGACDAMPSWEKGGRNGLVRASKTEDKKKMNKKHTWMDGESSLPPLSSSSL